MRRFPLQGFLRRDHSVLRTRVSLCALLLLFTAGCQTVPPGPDAVRPDPGVEPAALEVRRLAVVHTLVSAIEHLSMHYLVALDSEALLGQAISAMYAAYGKSLVMPKVPPADQIAAWTAALQEAEAARRAGQIYGAYTDLWRQLPTLDDDALVKAAINGMLAGLHPQDAFYDRAAFRRLRSGLVSREGAVGLTLVRQSGLVRVVRALPESPAHAAGISPGDTLMRVDGELIAPLSLEQVTARLVGKVGTTVTLQVQRVGAEVADEMTISRAKVKFRALSTRDFTGGIGYVRIFNLATNSVAELEAVLQKWHSQGQMKGLVLDLRYNPGGLLSEAVALVNLFIGEGAIVSVITHDEATSVIYKADRARLKDATTPLVVLVDQQTAAGAEVVAAALQQAGRAAVMGYQTYRQGRVRSVLTIGDHSMALVISTGMLMTPNGEALEARGVIPDICLAEPVTTMRKRDHCGSEAVSRIPGETTLDADLERAVVWLRQQGLARQGPTDFDHGASRIR